MERLEVEMFKNLKISKILIVILVVLCFGWISCTPTTADTTELFKEINRLERELELKETEIESLKNELEITKIQLEEALELQLKRRKKVKSLQLQKAFHVENKLCYLMLDPINPFAH